MALKDKLNLSKVKEKIDAGVKVAQDATSNININEVVQGAKDAAVIKAAEVGEALESGVKSAQEGISSFNVEDAVQGAKDAAIDGVNAIGKAIGDAAQATPEDAGEAKENGEEAAQLRNFIALLWCMAYADGSVSETEATALDDISNALDENYESYAVELKLECDRVIRQSSKEFGYHNAVKIEAQKLIESIKPDKTDAKLICWNLLSLANSDGVDENELDLIRFVSEKVDIDPAVFAELKNYSDAIAEIEQSLEALKQSGRSYGEIEPLVAEFTHREQTIIEAAQSLITDR